MVCIPFPEDTVNDRLLKTRIVVFARENPERFYVLAKDGVSTMLDTPIMC